MRPPRTARRLLATSLLVILALSLGGVAYAYSSGSGAGFGSATTGTAIAVALSPGTPDGDLIPGGQSDVTLTVSNPNTFEVRLGALALDPSQGTAGFTADAGHPACDVSTLSFTTQTNAGAGWTLPASGSLPIVLTSALEMGAGAVSACQGASFTIYLAAGP